MEQLALGSRCTLQDNPIFLLQPTSHLHLALHAGPLRIIPSPEAPPSSTHIHLSDNNQVVPWQCLLTAPNGSANIHQPLLVNGLDVFTTPGQCHESARSLVHISSDTTNSPRFVTPIAVQETSTLHWLGTSLGGRHCLGNLLTGKTRHLPLANSGALGLEPSSWVPTAEPWAFCWEIQLFHPRLPTTHGDLPSNIL